MKGRRLTKSDKNRFEKLRNLGCIVCIIDLEVFTTTSIHHIDGKTKEGAHDLTIPLCAKHHQHKDNHKPKRWVSRHGDGRYEFEDRYGSEQYLLEETNRRI